MTLARSLAVAVLAPVAAAQNPTPYCTAGTSTNGCTPSINANVQPNTANTAGCVITTSGVEGQKQGLTFYGVDNAGFTPTPWGAGGTSFLCVKPPTTRLGAPTNSGGTFGQCDGSYVISWDAFQAANPTALGNPWVLGDKVFVQSWYRDPAAVKTSNLSNALELTLRAPAPVPCVTTIPGTVVIPAGTFSMGSNAASGAPYFGSSTTQPVHQVTISYCYWTGVTEVTQAQYSALMGTNPSSFPGANNPVESVSWFDALAYCAALTAQQSAHGNVPPGYQYRLPTEAEWEYACRAGTTAEFNVGASLFCNQATFWYSDHSNAACNNSLYGTGPVGSYAPNAWGLYDMHGNVWEWCLDSYASYSSGAVTDPFFTGGPFRVFRGGSWGVNSGRCRSAYRGGGSPGGPSERLGFRVVLAPILVP
ncbi:MAG: formylglycine-generating enzyme family protein [Planctomycetes bacterium]|nr:formylglycine-generating enzyme family protein [Planctomycetota bacterium]